ncbi:MbnP family protein [Foetidibacter luteolus]|uniref:MbnP family protein n=1 Tax=Foetidibacter luteolus TaxID=2608880 RepID=UPI00129ACFD4|nr:MbnP family protein [Foetidibacter luteolus]
MTIHKIIIIVLFVAPLFTSCSKDAQPPSSTEERSSLSIEFDNIVGGQNLQLNTGSYTNAAGETFSVDRLQYFVSNISLNKTDGTVYTVPQDSSYFLVKEGEEDADHVTLSVPTGEYSSLSFVLGVDSLRSTMDIAKRTGALDPSGGMDDGMYWGWNSGYIFFKMEGLSPEAPVDPTGKHKFRYHIGGFGGYSAPTINNIKTVTLNLTPGGVAKVRQGRNSNIHLMVDVLKVFNGSTTVSLAANPQVMFSDYSVNIANNYATMFRHDHTEN